MAERGDTRFDALGAHLSVAREPSPFPPARLARVFSSPAFMGAASVGVRPSWEPRSLASLRGGRQRRTSRRLADHLFGRARSSLAVARSRLVERSSLVESEPVNSRPPELEESAAPHATLS